MRILKELYNVKVLSENEIISCLESIGWNKIMDSIYETFIEEAKGNTISPPKVIMSFGEYDNDYRIMPSMMFKYPQFCGTKIIGACSSNPKKFGLPLAMGLYVLNSAETLIPLLIFDASITTAYRTAAASAVAIRELSKTNSKILGIIGCGQQAYYHTKACLSIRDIDKIYFYDISKEKMDDMARGFNRSFISSKEEIFEKSDIIITLTPTKNPHINVSDIPNRDMMICAVGGDSDIKMEFYPEVLGVVDHFCDSYDQVSHTGVVIKAMEFGVIKKEDLKSLGDFITRKAMLDDTKKVKMFLSTGVALEDLAIARLLYEHIK